MYIKRFMEPLITASFQTEAITAILGPRRVGKTSLVEHILQQLLQKQIPAQRMCLLNLDLMQVRNRINNQEFKALIEESCLQKIGGESKLLVAIDEAQKCPALFDQIKIIYDEWKDKEKIKFILTGSAHLSLHQLSAETLAGRIDIYYLQPFTLREASKLHIGNIPAKSILNLICEESAEELPHALSSAIDELSPYKPIMQENLNKLLIWGGLPEMAAMEDINLKKRYLDNYIDTYLEQDVRKIATITDLNLYKNLMDIIAQQTGSLRDDGRLIEVLRCGRDTLKKYRGYLQATLLYVEIFPYITTAINKLVKSPKGYMLDNGIISNLTGIFDLSILTTTGAIGHRFENWFLQELLAWTAQFPVREEINFWRLATGVEVDFVVTIKPNIYPFEVTYGTRPVKNKINNLKKFLAQKADIPWGFYIYNGEYATDQQNKIIYLPAWCI